MSKFIAIAARTNRLLLPTRIKCQSFCKLTITTKPNFCFRHPFKGNFSLNCVTICKACCFTLKLLGQTSRNSLNLQWGRSYLRVLFQGLMFSGVLYQE